jgi:hypothetical protein
MGYSEGGYATMAVHRAMETSYADEFTVTASAPMAGPYNLSEVMVDQILDTTAYASPMYLPFTILAYNDIYGLFTDPASVFAPPYAERLCRLFDGSQSMRSINSELPEVPREMLQPSFIAAFQSDPDHPLRRALRDNDLDNWAPSAPMRMHHCRGDDQVPYRNAEAALAAFKERGAEQVELSTLEFGNHQDCAAPSLFLGKLWFDSFLNESPVTPTASTQSSGVALKGGSQ